MGPKMDKHEPFEPSSDARAAYEWIQTGRPLPEPGTEGASSVPMDGYAAAVEELIERHLVARNPFSERSYVQYPHDDVWHHHVMQALGTITEEIKYLHSIREVLATLPRAIDSNGSGGFSYLSNKTKANDLIISSLAKAEHRVWSAQPAPRTSETMEIVRAGDLERLERGVEYRDLYKHSARERDPESRYVEEITKAGAQVRTGDDFLRIVIVDEMAIISDVRAGAAWPTAWQVTNPGLVAWIAEVYRMQWRRAVPWSSEQVLTPTHIPLSERQRDIIDLLGRGAKRETIAKALKCSTRTLQKEISQLYKIFNVKNEFSLGQAATRSNIVGCEPDEA